MSLKQLLEHARRASGYITLTDAAIKSFGGDVPSEPKFAFSDPDAEILSHKSLDQEIVKDFPAEAAALFDAIITDNRKDRDGDILESKGAKIVKRMPLLLGHDWDKVVGVMVRTLEHDERRIVGRFAIADTAEGRDVAKLVRMRAFRISHGFLPEDFEPIKDKNDAVTGFTIKSFEIYETSLVAVPANARAVILDDYEKSFESTAVKHWAKSLYENRDRLFPGIDLQKDAAVEEPVAEEPVAEEQPTEEPAAEEQPTEEPAAEEQPTEEPAAEEQPTEEPAAEEQPTEEPAAETPAAEESVAEEPAAEEQPVAPEQPESDESGPDLDTETDPILSLFS